MKNKTRDYQTGDGNVQFELSISETLSEKTTYRYLLNGWVQGFGPRSKIFPDVDHHGPYECQYWLKGVLPQEVLDTITFDSESSEFYIYSSDRESLEIILDVLTDTIDRLNNCLEEYTFQMLQVFNGPLPISLWAHPKVHTIGGSTLVLPSDLPGVNAG
tara:strand:- start:39 stop:515 length:477 start_codon:yes stop_codon:yes gene_type:complete